MAEGKTKSALWACVVGALIGGLLSTWLAPKAISWYFNPPAQMGFNCSQPIDWALGKLQLAQFFGILIGAGAGIAVFFSFMRGRSNGV